MPCPRGLGVAQHSARSRAQPPLRQHGHLDPRRGDQDEQPPRDLRGARPDHHRARRSFTFAADPERLSRERYLSHYDSYARRDRGEPEWAERFGGDIGDHVDPDLVHSDLEELRRGTAKTKDLVDKHLAHTDKKPMASPATFAELHSAIGAINLQFEKYVLLLTVVELLDARPDPTVRLARDFPRAMDQVRKWAGRLPNAKRFRGSRPASQATPAPASPSRLLVMSRSACGASR
jgi:hypothetical protein